MCVGVSHHHPIFYLVMKMNGYNKNLVHVIYVNFHTFGYEKLFFSKPKEGAIYAQ